YGNAICPCPPIMAIEKAAALREAEKLLRTGQLAQAIEGYEQIVDADADDWQTRSLLAQLHARAGAPGKAVEHLASAADILHLSGDTATAESLYSKILTIRPDHAHALRQLDEIRVDRASGAALPPIAAAPVVISPVPAVIAPAPAVSVRTPVVS